MNRVYAWAIAALLPCMLSACTAASTIVIERESCAQYEIAYVPSTGWHIDVLDTLRQPIPVVGCGGAGIELADGRVLRFDGIDLARFRSTIDEICQQGIEISHGCAYGLLWIWHSCGSDPIRQHIARLDIAEMLEFMIETNRTWFGMQTDFYLFVEWQRDRAKRWNRD